MTARSTATPTEFDAEFIRGFGEYLASAELGKWSTFTSSDTGIVAGKLPASPYNAIALASYGVSDDPTLSDSVIGLQVTVRGANQQDPRPTQRLTSRVYDQLDGMAGVTLPGGVYVVQCHRQSWTTLGQDENNRWREVSNFYVTVHRPSKYRI